MAQPPRKAREHTIGGAAPQSAPRKASAPQPAAGQDAAELKRRAEIERMLHDRERLLEVRRKQAIDQLNAFIASEPEASEYMADALLRLAELRWEQARMDYLARYDRWQHTPAAQRSAAAPVPDIAVSLALYDRILERHREFERYDLVLYMKAYALVEAGRTREALFAYRRIIDEFPSSRFVPDAHMAFAEWYFSGSYDYAAALEEFDAVLAHRESELADLALFKSAWCMWKLGNSTGAAKRFREVLDLANASSGHAEASAERQRRVLELKDEALEYLIQVFTEDESNTAADLHGFLTQIGGEKYAFKILNRLSATFFDQARYDRAVQAYSMLLQSAPDSPEAPEYQHKIAEAYAAQDDADNAIAALIQLARAYKANGPWAQHQSYPQAVQRAAFMAEQSLRAQAMRYHERGQKERQLADLKHAAALYRAVLAEFPNSVFDYEASFYLAEILFHHLQQPQQAAEMYLWAAKLRPGGELTRDALYNSIVAFESVRSAELQGCKSDAAAPSTPATPVPTAARCVENATDHNFAEAITLYVEGFPDDPEVPGILFRQGRINFERGLYDPAVRQFGQLLDRYPTSDYAASAGELVLESFNRAHDYRNIETWARKLKSAPAFKGEDTQRKLDALILQSVFKVGEALSAQQQHAEAAAAYLKAAHEFPHDERAPKAYYNAGQEAQLAGKIDAAAAAYDELIAHHPGTEAGALGAWSAAQMFEATAQFKDAARYYTTYVERFPKADKRADALYNAVLLQLAAGQYADAAHGAARYSQLYPNQESADEMLILIGRAQESAARWDAAAAAYRDCAQRCKSLDRRVEANVRLAQALTQRGDAHGAQRALKDALAPNRKALSPQGHYFAAQARFQQGDAVLAEFDRIQIVGQRAALDKRLEQKAELLRKAAAIYGEVVEYKVAEWVAAALFKIGHSYELFAEALRNAPMPSGLNEAQQQAYRDQLGTFVVPIEERALSAYESGYRKALELHVFNEWTERLREGLTRLNQVEYPPLREIGTEVEAGAMLAPPLPLATLQRAPIVAERAGGKRR